MNRSRLIVFVAVLALCWAAPSLAATKFTCNSSGKVWSLSPGSSPIEVTAMFANGSTDCDLFVDDGFGTIIAMGVCMESRYESIKFGPLPGVRVRVTAMKAAGPNSKVYLRVSDSLRILRAGREDGLTEIGRAVDLAERDPAYAQALEQMRRYQRLKAPAARNE